MANNETTIWLATNSELSPNAMVAKVISEGMAASTALQAEPKPTGKDLATLTASVAAMANLAPDAIALTIKADTIVANRKAASGTVKTTKGTGHTLNLTVAHIRDDATFSLAFDPDTRTATVTRTEGKRGRKATNGAPIETVSAFVNSLVGLRS